MLEVKVSELWAKKEKTNIVGMTRAARAWVKSEKGTRSKYADRGQWNRRGLISQIGIALRPFNRFAGASPQLFLLPHHGGRPRPQVFRSLVLKLRKVNWYTILVEIVNLILVARRKSNWFQHIWYGWWCWRYSSRFINITGWKCELACL